MFENNILFQQSESKPPAGWILAVEPPRPDLGGLMEATNTKSRFSNALHYPDKNLIVLR